MSSSVFTKTDSATLTTRRAPTAAAEAETPSSSQQTAGRRSLSGKFRNLFRKNSPSPKRRVTMDERSEPRPQSSSSTRQTSSSEPVRTSLETPQLRTPTISWPFGKKTKGTTTANTTSSTSTKGKTKSPKKYKQKGTPSTYASTQGPIEDVRPLPYPDSVARRPMDPTMNLTERPPSYPNYELTPTKGFRDYMVLDQGLSNMQKNEMPVDVATTPTYRPDRTPSLSTDQTFTNPYITEPSITSSIDPMILGQERPRANVSPSLNTPTQLLASQVPLLPVDSHVSLGNHPTSIHVAPPRTNPTDLNSSSSSSAAFDSPKFRTPSVSFGSSSIKHESKSPTYPPRAEEIFISPHGSEVPKTHRETYSNWTTTHGSLPDAEMVNSAHFSTLEHGHNSYPGLMAIVAHHLPMFSKDHFHRPETTATSPQNVNNTTVGNLVRPPRFDASTTTSNAYDERHSWANNANNGSSSSSSSSSTTTKPFPSHDGYIRPLTPDQTTNGNRNHHQISQERSRSPSTTHLSKRDSPVIYRSSTTIYTRDKHQYVEGGEVRTWSVREARPDDTDFQRSLYRNLANSIQIGQRHYDRSEVESLQSNSVHSNPRRERNEQFVYYNETGNTRPLNYDTPINGQYSEKTSNSMTTSRSSRLNEREKPFAAADPLIQSLYANNSQQESLNRMAPVGDYPDLPRHYTLKRTDSYDGLGILLSADLSTRLQHCIRDVETNSPAYRAGLRKNDRIIAVNGIDVENVEFGDVLLLIKQGLSNNNLQFTVVNDPSIND